MDLGLYYTVHFVFHLFKIFHSKKLGDKKKNKRIFEDSLDSGKTSGMGIKPPVILDVGYEGRKGIKENS